MSKVQLRKIVECLLQEVFIFVAKSDDENINVFKPEKSALFRILFFHYSH